MVAQTSWGRISPVTTSRPSESAGPPWADNPEASIFGSLLCPGFLFGVSFHTQEELAHPLWEKGPFLGSCGVCCSF